MAILGILMILAGAVMVIAGIVCGLIIIIDAFQNEVWKGIVYWVFPIYGLYYMFAEFEHENKFAIIAAHIAGPIVGAILVISGIASMVSH
jgi:hypothetical protein